MVQNVDLNQVKQYNETLKIYKDKSAKLSAEIEYTTKELDRLCLELTSELGIQVTTDNIEDIYNEQVEKINSTLKSGNAVLAKIASEQNGEAYNNKNISQQKPISQQQITQSPVQQSIPVEPVTISQINNQAFNGAVAAGTLPTLFS